MKKKFSIFLFLTFIMTMFTACGEKTDEAKVGGLKEPSDVSVVFIPKLIGNMFFESANEGGKAMADKVGYNYKYDGTTNATVADQVQVINSANNQGYNAIVISSNSPDGLNEALKNAAENGAKIVTWDSDVNPEYRSLMVSQGTPKQLGEMLINMVADQIDDAENKAIKFAFFYSSPTVTDQNSWVDAAKKYVGEKYPKWELLTTEYGESDAQKSIQVGESILNTYPDIDVVIAPDSTALPGMAQAAKNLGKTKEDLIITGFSTPSSMREFIKDGTIDRFGLWDSKAQGAMGSYLGYYLAAGNTFKVGDKIDIPTIGVVEVMPNSVLGHTYLSEDSGVVLMPERTVFDINNIDDFNF